MAEKKKQTYAQAIAELEEIVAKLQNNECEIDELKTYTNRSLSLLKFCKDKLFETDEEIKKLLMLKSGTKVWYIERVRKKYRAFLDGKRRKRFSF